MIRSAAALSISVITHFLAGGDFITTFSDMNIELACAA
jgi:hypothetical protein